MYIVGISDVLDGSSPAASGPDNNGGVLRSLGDKLLVARLLITRLSWVDSRGNGLRLRARELFVMGMRAYAGPRRYGERGATGKMKMMWQYIGWAR